MIVKMPRAPEARKAALAHLLAARIPHMRLFQAVEIADAAAAQAFRTWLIEEGLLSSSGLIYGTSPGAS
jgi:hypothetical protein